MMREVNPRPSAEGSGLFANPTQRGEARRVFWLATVCLFLSGAVWMRLGTIPVYLLNPILWLIVLPLWFMPIIVSDIRAGARRADRRRSGAFAFIANMPKMIGIVFLIMCIATCSVLCLSAVCFSSPSASVRFQEVANSITAE